MKRGRREKSLAEAMTVDGEVYLFRAMFVVNREMLVGVSRLTGMPAAKLGILRSVEMAGPEGIGIVDISQELGLDAAAITRHVAHLADEGYVTRSEDSSDKRRVSVRITQMGRDLNRKLYDYLRTVEKAMLAGVPKEDIDATMRVLGLVHEALKI